MHLKARVIKKPKGNGISPEGCKKQMQIWRQPGNYFFALCRSLFVFFCWLCVFATLATFAYLYFIYGSFCTFSLPLAFSFEVPIYQGSFYIVQQCHLFVNLFLLGLYELDFFNILQKILWLYAYSVCLFFYHLLKVGYSYKWNY